MNGGHLLSSVKMLSDIVKMGLVKVDTKLVPCNKCMCVAMKSHNNTVYIITVLIGTVPEKGLLY